MTSLCNSWYLMFARCLLYLPAYPYFLIPCVLIPSIRVLWGLNTARRSGHVSHCGFQHISASFCRILEGIYMSCRWPLFGKFQNLVFGTRILRGMTTQWTSFTSARSELAWISFDPLIYWYCCSCRSVMHSDEVHLWKIWWVIFLHIKLRLVDLSGILLLYWHEKILYPNISLLYATDHVYHQ